MVETLTPNGANHPFYVSSLPGRMRCRQHLVVRQNAIHRTPPGSDTRCFPDCSTVLTKSEFTEVRSSKPGAYIKPGGNDEGVSHPQVCTFQAKSKKLKPEKSVGRHIFGHEFGHELRRVACEPILLPLYNEVTKKLHSILTLRKDLR
jgi:hypothetical protein